MKVNNHIEQIGKIELTVQVLKNNEVKHIAYKYGEIEELDENDDKILVTKVYQAWLVSTDNNYVIETDRDTILLEIDNIAFQLKKRWANQGKSVAIRLDLESKIDQTVSEYKG